MTEFTANDTKSFPGAARAIGTPGFGEEEFMTTYSLMIKRTFFGFLLLLCGNTIVTAEKIRFFGTATERDHEPAIAALICEIDSNGKETNNKVIADCDGNYVITVDNGGELIYHYARHKSEVRKIVLHEEDKVWQKINVHPKSKNAFSNPFRP